MKDRLPGSSKRQLVWQEVVAVVAAAAVGQCWRLSGLSQASVDGVASSIPWTRPSRKWLRLHPRVWVSSLLPSNEDSTKIVPLAVAKSKSFVTPKLTKALTNTKPKLGKDEIRNIIMLSCVMQ